MFEIHQPGSRKPPGSGTISGIQSMHCFLPSMPSHRTAHVSVTAGGSIGYGPRRAGARNHTPPPSPPAAAPRRRRPTAARAAAAAPGRLRARAASRTPARPAAACPIFQYAPPGPCGARAPTAHGLSIPNGNDHWAVTLLLWQARQALAVCRETTRRAAALLRRRRRPPRQQGPKGRPRGR